MKFYYGKEVSKEFIETKLDWDKGGIISKTARKLAKLSKENQLSCYICGGKRIKKESEFYGINYVRCQKCSLVFATKKPSETVLDSYYSEDQNYSKLAYANKKSLKLREDLVQPKIHFIKRFVKGKKWLDVGSADGASVVVINHEGFQGTGIEISDNSRKFAKKYRNIILNPKPLEVFSRKYKTKWNAISFFGVLEHLSDPIKALKISHRIMADEGIIAVAVPNYDSLSTHVQQLLDNPDRHLIPYSHSMMFTLKSLKYAFHRTGFKPLAVWWWGMDMIEFLKYLDRTNEKFVNSQLRGALIEKLNQLQEVVDHNQLGDEFMMIGRRYNV